MNHSIKVSPFILHSILYLLSPSRTSTVGGPVVSVLTVIVPPSEPAIVTNSVGSGVDNKNARVGESVSLFSGVPTVSVTDTEGFVVVEGDGTGTGMRGTNGGSGKHSTLQDAGQASEADSPSLFISMQSILGSSATAAQLFPVVLDQSSSLSQFRVTMHSSLQDAGQASVADTPALSTSLQRVSGSEATASQSAPVVLDQSSSLSQFTVTMHSSLHTAGQASEAVTPVES
mmetsp:Transcript_12406/g.17818  ORF Transcript_12406/g.17818 Transcript_12406/m.17818 type:complete len:230 (-) Transcript_12406:243-932(-)